MTEYYVQVTLPSGSIRTFRTARLETALRAAATAHRERLPVIMGMEMGHAATRA